jgi:nicotinate-nucleotide adenylyltransferase
VTSGEKKRIALYGGAFDPPHNGHMATIALLLNSGSCDEIVVVPSGDRPDKQYGATVEDRLTMTRSALAEAFVNDPRVVLCEEHAAGKIGFGTIDLVDYFKKTRPASDLLVVIGTELLKDLHTWKAAERLRALATFLVIARPGASTFEAPAGWRCERLNAPYDAGVLVSSTTLRTLIAQGKSVAGLVPASVAKYCIHKRLYGSR